MSIFKLLREIFNLNKPEQTMPKPKPFSVQTKEGRVFEIELSPKKDARYLVRYHAGDQYHIDKKENVFGLIEDLGFTPVK